MNREDDEARRALGRVLRGIRRSRGVSQAVLAHSADVGRTYLGSVDRGERNPSFEHILQLLRALGVSWAEFGAALDREPATRVVPLPAGTAVATHRVHRRVRPPAKRPRE